MISTNFEFDFDDIPNFYEVCDTQYFLDYIIKFDCNNDIGNYI